MRETKTKLKTNEKGITLIALVITIIVLLILAGVAISMLSGENGILRQAAESKIKTEDGQREEMSSLFSYEMAMDTNSKYKYQHGYLTGFEYDEESDHTVETVADVEKSLPNGYKIVSKYEYNSSERTGKDVPIKEEDKETTYISTGMVIEKDGQEVGRTVLFGDTNCDGVFNKDSMLVSRYLDYWEDYNLTHYQKVAGNVYSDNELNEKDISVFREYQNGDLEGSFNQKANISKSGKEFKRFDTIINEYISLLDEETTGYKFEYDNKTDTYKLKGVQSGTTAQTLLSKLPTTENVKIVNESGTEIQADEPVTSVCCVELTIEYIVGLNPHTITPTFAYIEVED